MKRESIKTKIQDVIKYWSSKEDECDLSVDWIEADTHCWRCGCQKNLQRCHIIPDALGGEDSPSNIVLLCERCHQEAPNVTDSEIMWDWIKAYSVSYYETFWQIRAMREYHFIYHRTVEEEIEYILEEADVSPESEVAIKILKNKMRNAMHKAGVHFGQSYFNVATIAGVYRMMLKDIAKEYGVPFPRVEKVGNESEKPWWGDIY